LKRKGPWNFCKAQAEHFSTATLSFSAVCLSVPRQRLGSWNTIIYTTRGMHVRWADGVIPTRTHDLRHEEDRDRHVRTAPETCWAFTDALRIVGRPFS
jgi:hypothetical protein